MNIDIAESLVYSWLKHVKGCQIIHRNWKGVAQSEPLISDEIRNAYNEAINGKSNSENTSTSSADLDKKIKQALKQTECDVLGLEFAQDGSIKYHAVEVAFHSKGLNYSGENAKKVSDKLFRIAIALKHYLNISSATLYFVSPFVREKELDAIEAAVKNLEENIRVLGTFPIELCFNEDFYVNILHGTKNKDKQNVDLSELCIRSYELEDLYNKIQKDGHKVEVENMEDADVEKIKIGLLVRTQFMPYLKDGILSESEIKELKEWKIGKFPVLRKVEEIPNEEKCRYYATPISLFGASYKVCNHWFANDEENCSKLKNWIELLQRKSS